MPSLGVHEADPADCAYGDIDSTYTRADRSRPPWPSRAGTPLVAVEQPWALATAPGVQRRPPAQWASRAAAVAPDVRRDSVAAALRAWQRSRAATKARP